MMYFLQQLPYHNSSKQHTIYLFFSFNFSRSLSPLMFPWLFISVIIMRLDKTFFINLINVFPISFFISPPLFWPLCDASHPTNKCWRWFIMLLYLSSYNDYYSFGFDSHLSNVWFAGIFFSLLWYEIPCKDHI